MILAYLYEDEFAEFIGARWIIRTYKGVWFHFPNNKAKYFEYGKDYDNDPKNYQQAEVEGISSV